MAGVAHFIRAKRELVDGDKEAIRFVYRSELVREKEDKELGKFFAEKIPYFYRSVEDIVADVRAGYFTTAISNSVLKLPTAESFKTSHFGEIAAGVFAEDVLGLRRLYSKLALLTSENANAYKMDLLLYDSSKKPFELLLGEVKCSPKFFDDGLPAKHDESCYADMFRSLKDYDSGDLQFDLTAAKANLKHLPESDQEIVRTALLPYSDTVFKYIGFAVIDASTFDLNEAQILRTRKSEKLFNVDIICLESYPLVSMEAYRKLKAIYDEAK